LSEEQQLFQINESVRDLIKGLQSIETEQHDENKT